MSASVGFSYDGAGRRTALSLSNGVVTECAYDAGPRLTRLTYKLGTAVLGTLTYAYDAAGNRTGVGGTWGLRPQLGWNCHRDHWNRHIRGPLG